MSLNKKTVILALCLLIWPSLLLWAQDPPPPFPLPGLPVPIDTNLWILVLLGAILGLFFWIKIARRTK